VLQAVGSLAPFAIGEKRIRRLAFPALSAMAAFAVVGFGGTTTDVSWLLTCGEKWLSGQALYADLIEPNPPISILLYAPAILFGRLAGVDAELAVKLLVGAAGTLSIGLTGWIIFAARLVGERDRPWLIASLILVLGMLPGDTFAQREHIALLALLPALAILAARAAGQTPSWPAALLAGLGAGLAIVIKPHFVLPLALAEAYVAVRGRSLWPLLGLELWVAASLAIAYGMLVILVFPAYFELLRALREVYVLASQPLPGLIARTCIWAAMIGGAAFFARHRFHEPLPMVMAAASAGFAAAFILQGKGFPYHGYPMVALAALVLSLAVADARFASSRHPPGLVLVAATALIACPPYG
jgi:hypothetical protein